MNSVTDVWNLVLDSLKAKLTPVAMAAWFDDCRPVELTGSRLALYTPSLIKKQLLQERFLPDIKASLDELFSTDFEVVILGDEEMEDFRASAAPDKSAAQSDSSEYTFDTFVVGPSNKFAHAAALAVAQGADKYNPLFIYGNSGLGKTHLLCAVRHEIRLRHPKYHIVFVKGDTFTNELISAIQSGRNAEFRDKYRNADLFLMDDVQFIAGRESTQEEMFHTFNTLTDNGKQIVFTADRPPEEMLRLDDRLRTRFSSGLIACVEPPDYETRVAIIRNKAIQLGMALPEDVTEYVAQNITSNIRQIEGSVKKIKAYRDLMENNLSVPNVAKVLKDMFKDKTEYIPTPEIIIEETAKYYNLAPEDLRGQSRTRNTALARQISMYLIRKISNLSLNDIGELYSGRDHTTVLSSIKKTEQAIATSAEFSQTIRDITANINSRS